MMKTEDKRSEDCSLLRRGRFGRCFLGCGFLGGLLGGLVLLRSGSLCFRPGCTLNEAGLADEVDESLLPLDLFSADFLLGSGLPLHRGLPYISIFSDVVEEAFLPLDFLFAYFFWHTTNCKQSQYLNVPSAGGEIA